MNTGRSGRRVALEVVVIVGSILLAFGIEAWWSARQDRGRIDAALGNLEVGFTAHLDLIDAELRRMEPYAERVTFFLNPEGDVDRVGGYGPVLEAIHRPIVEPLNTDELMALLEAEALRDLDAAGLWAASAAWRGEWRIILDRHDSLYELEDEALRALAEQRATRVVVTDADALNLVHSGSLRSARGDEGLVALASVKAYHLTVLALLYGALRSEAEAVLSEVRAELTR